MAKIQLTQAKIPSDSPHPSLPTLPSLFPEQLLLPFAWFDFRPLAKDLKICSSHFEKTNKHIVE